MRYYVQLGPVAPDNAPVLVDVEELPSGKLSVRVGGRPVSVDVADLGHALSIRIDGRMVDLTTEGTPPELGAVLSGHRLYARVESERLRAAALARKGATSTGETLVKSPMPGRIIKLMVAKGDTVAPGDPLVVVEAMKMENEVRAKAAGRIAEVFVSVGATVEANGKLLRFEA
jgi:glutaconyl-CoA/methylmalonyl-CoA decarboxylase subunit gamma